MCGNGVLCSWCGLGVVLVWCLEGRRRDGVHDPGIFIFICWRLEVAAVNRSPRAHEVHARAHFFATCLAPTHIVLLR